MKPTEIQFFSWCPRRGDAGHTFAAVFDPAGWGTWDYRVRLVEAFPRLGLAEGHETFVDLWAIWAWREENCI